MELVGSTIVQQAGLSVMNAQKGVLPHGWLEYVDDASGRPYYYNVSNRGAAQTWRSGCADTYPCFVPRRYTIGRQPGTSRRRQLRRLFWGRKAMRILTASSTWRPPLRRTPSPSLRRSDARCAGGGVCQPESRERRSLSCSQLLLPHFAYRR